MKRRPVVSLVLMMSILGSLTSCKEEEFYEKEYIQTFQEEYEDSIIEDLYDPAGPDDHGGSTPGDNGGSSTGDNDNDDNDPLNLESVNDSFLQSASGTNKVDILWVIDNSGSMREEQAALAYNFDAFINKFIEKDIDFKMAITTTDPRYNNAGRPVSGSIDKLTSTKLAQNEQQFLNDFSDLIQVGVNGWSREEGIKASEKFVTRGFAQQHFREDAYFVVVYLSDEEDQSDKTPEQHLAEISAWKNNPGLVKAYSIVNISAPYNASQYLVPGYERYEAMSTLTGGYISDINESFYNTLLNMGNDIAELTESFPLSQVPYSAADIKVFVNGVEQVDGWEYDEQSRTIKFLPGSVPPTNATINVSYEVES